MTYNVENLFDTRHDTLKNDTEYTSEGGKQWSEGRMRRKIHNIMQVIAGQDELPVLVGLCEVENDSVLEIMTSGRYRNLGYGYLHQEGSDVRGIDVALLYLKDVFKVDTFFLVGFGMVKREVLYVRGNLVGGGELHVMQVHAPSRRGGAVVTEGLRSQCAAVIRGMVDSIFRVDSLANILIMGDFNDTPEDRALTDVLRAGEVTDSVSCDGLYNLVMGLQREGKGSYCYQKEWSMLDQIIVSGAMLEGWSGIQVSPSAEVYSPGWLLDGNGRPKRTYLGDFYQGGVSDHLPVICRGKIL